MKENFTYGLMRRGWYPQPFTLPVFLVCDIIKGGVIRVNRGRSGIDDIIKGDRIINESGFHQPGVFQEPGRH